MILSKTNVTRLLRFVKASVPCISEHCGVLWENCPTRCLFWLSTTREQRAVVWCFACSIQRRCLAQIVPWLHPQSVKVPRLSWLKGWVTVEACCYQGGDVADCKKNLGTAKILFPSIIGSPRKSPLPWIFCSCQIFLQFGARRGVPKEIGLAERSISTITRTQQ